MRKAQAMLSLLVPWSRRTIEWGQIAPLTHFRTAYGMSLVFVRRISIATQRQYTSSSLVPHTRYTAATFIPFVRKLPITKNRVEIILGKLKITAV